MNNEKTRAEFTNWLDTLAYRTKLNYIRAEKKHQVSFSIDELPEDRLESEEFHVAFEFSVEGEFNFEAEWLEKAFAKLSDTCKEILKLMYIEGKTTQEVAVQMKCSAGYVYKQRAKAFDLIRKEGEKR